MKKIIFLLLALACAQFLVPSCSKKSSPAPACKMVTIVENDGGSNSTVYNITYDNNGRISTLQSVSSSLSAEKAYTYSGSTILIATTTNLSSYTDSITVNSAGYMVSDLNRSGPDKNWTTYTYGSGNQIQKSVSQDNSNPAVTITYTYTNGDLTGISDGTNTSTLTYNTNKASSAGDYLQVLQLVDYGAPCLVSAHQIASYSTSGSTTDFNYTTDNTGKITVLTATIGSAVETLTYQYQCK